MTSCPFYNNTLVEPAFRCNRCGAKRDFYYGKGGFIGVVLVILFFPAGLGAILFFGTIIFFALYEGSVGESPIELGLLVIADVLCIGIVTWTISRNKRKKIPLDTWKR